MNIDLLWSDSLYFPCVNFASKETLRDFVDAFPDNLKKEVLIGLKDKLPSREITQEGTSVSQFYVEVDDNNWTAILDGSKEVRLFGYFHPTRIIG